MAQAAGLLEGLGGADGAASGATDASGGGDSGLSGLGQLLGQQGNTGKGGGQSGGGNTSASYGDPGLLPLSERYHDVYDKGPGVAGLMALINNSQTPEEPWSSGRPWFRR